MPLLSTLGNKTYGFAARLLRKITDNFARTTAGSLGLSSSNHLWSAVRGIWIANGSAGTTSGAGNTYPIAAVSFQEDIPQASLNVNSGTGIAFWVTDSGSWWGSAYVQQNWSQQYSYGCTQYYYDSCKTCSSYTCAGACGNAVAATADTMNCSCNNGTTSYGCPYSSHPNYSSGYCWNAYYSSYIPPESYTTGGTSNCACGNATSGSPDTNNCGCCCQGGSVGYSTTCTGTNSGTYHYLRLINSVGGTVSTVTGDISLGATAAAIALSTSGNTITAKAYSDTAKTNQIGSTQTYTPVSPTRGRSVGIVAVPSDNANYSVGGFEVKTQL